MVKRIFEGSRISTDPQEIENVARLLGVDPAKLTHVEIVSLGHEVGIDSDTAIPRCIEMESEMNEQQRPGDGGQNPSNPQPSNPQPGQPSQPGQGNPSR